MQPPAQVRVSVRFRRRAVRRAAPPRKIAVGLGVVLLCFLGARSFAVDGGAVESGMLKPWQIASKIDGEYENAMKEGRFADAISWAQTGRIFRAQGPEESECFSKLAVACEYAGEWDRAEKAYREQYRLLYRERGEANWNLARQRPRVLYGRGKKREAFEAICSAAQREIGQNSGDSVQPTFRQRSSASLYFWIDCCEIVCPPKRYGGGEGIFTKERREAYPKFLKFVQDEYEKAGKPEKYADAMNYFLKIEKTPPPPEFFPPETPAP